MASTRTLDKQPRRTRGSRRNRATEKAFVGHHVSGNIRKTANVSSSSRNRFGFVVPETYKWNVYQLALITKRKIWWNYLTADQVLKLAEMAMVKSKKPIPKPFSFGSIIHFLEKNLIQEDEEEYDEDGHMYYERFGFSFDSDQRKVIYERNISYNFLYERSIICDNHKLSKVHRELLNLVSIIIEKVGNISNVLTLNWEYYAKNTSPEELVGIRGEYIENEEEEIRLFKHFEKGFKYAKSDRFKRRVERYKELETKNPSLDLVMGRIYDLNKKTRKPILPEKLADFETLVEMSDTHQHIFEQTDYAPGIHPLATWTMKDSYPESSILEDIHDTAVHYDMENMGIEAIYCTENLMEPTFTELDYLKTFVRCINHL